MSSLNMALQSTYKGSLKRAKFASERFLVSVLILHVAFQVLPESGGEQTILAVMLAFAAEQCRSGVTPLVGTQTLFTSADSI